MLSSVGFIEETAKTHLPECDTRAEILTGCEELKRSIYRHNLDHHLPKTRGGPDHRLVTTAIDKLAWTAATAEPAGLGSAMTGKTSLWNLLQDHLSGYTSNDTKEEITSRFKSLSHQPTPGWNILKTTGLACASAAAATLLGNSVYYAPLGALAHQLTSQATGQPGPWNTVKQVPGYLQKKWSEWTGAASTADTAHTAQKSPRHSLSEIDLRPSCLKIEDSQQPAARKSVHWDPAVTDTASRPRRKARRTWRYHHTCEECDYYSKLEALKSLSNPDLKQSTGVESSPACQSCASDR